MNLLKYGTNYKILHYKTVWEKKKYQSISIAVYYRRADEEVVGRSVHWCGAEAGVSGKTKTYENRVECTGISATHLWAQTHGLYEKLGRRYTIRYCSNSNYRIRNSIWFDTISFENDISQLHRSLHWHFRSVPVILSSVQRMKMRTHKQMNLHIYLNTSFVYCKTAKASEIATLM